MPPTSYYIKPRDLGADYRRGSARAYVDAGRYDDAARTIGGDDPDAARSYAEMADRERTQRERDEARSYARNYAGALHRGDYSAASQEAANFGDPEGVSGARTAQAAVDEQERMKLLRGMQQTLGELEQIEANGGQGYDAWWGRAQVALQQNPQMGPEMSGIISRLPKQWNPRVSGALRTRFQRMLESNLEPEELARLQREERTAARNQRQSLTPEQVAAAGLQPGTVAQTDGSGQIYVVQSPRAPASGGGAQTYRPISPEEAQAYGLPNDGQGFAMGSNGRPVRIGGGGQASGVFPAEQRARVAITFTPAMEAAQTLDSMEAGGYRPHHDVGAAAIDVLPFMDSAARVVGGMDLNPAQRGDYGRYRSAASSFESAILPILSGAAVTESEARRTVRATLPLVGDSDQVLADKSRRRRQMLNGAAVIGGQPLPFPDEATPSWATNAQNAVNSAPEVGVGLPSLTDEQFEALERQFEGQ